MGVATQRSLSAGGISVRQRQGDGASPAIHHSLPGSPSLCWAVGKPGDTGQEGDAEACWGSCLANWGFMQPDTRGSYLPGSTLDQACFLEAGVFELSQRQTWGLGLCPLILARAHPGERESEQGRLAALVETFGGMGGCDVQDSECWAEPWSIGQNTCQGPTHTHG